MEPKPYTGCIYLAMNRVTGIGYIGKSILGIANRRQHHESVAKRGKGAAFAAAMREHGLDAFDWSELFTSDDDQTLLWAEKEIIAWFGRDGLYNLCSGGQGPTGVVWSDERRRRFSEARKGMKFSAEHKRNMGLARPKTMPAWTVERRAKFTKTWSEKPNRSQSAEHRTKLSAAAKARIERDGLAQHSAAGKKGAAVRWGKR